MVMTTRSTFTALAMVLVVSFVLFQPAFVSAEQGIADDFMYPMQAVELRLEPSFSFGRAAHVANGIAMRNRIEGTIHLRGIPVGATVLQALLYVTILDDLAVGANGLGVIFNGNLVSAQKVADSADPCWGRAGAHTYRIGVNRFISMTRPNQDYEVTIAIRNINTDGENPWLSFGPERLLEGATLIVVYRTDVTSGSVYIYDAFNNSMFSSTGTFFLLHPNEMGAALFTMTGADGQRGGGYDNGTSTETTFFNGTQIAGPGAEAVGGLSASDWNGMAGWPLNQLWDVQTHFVGVDATVSTVDYNSPGDCLVPAAMVIDVQ